MVRFTPAGLAVVLRKVGFSVKEAESRVLTRAL